MATSSRDQRANIDALSDPFARRALFTAYHVRRYAVLYVCGLLGAIALAMFPTYAGGHVRQIQQREICLSAQPGVAAPLEHVAAMVA